MPTNTDAWDLQRLQSVIGLGVAGNFAGHLEQAGEASDFVGVTAAAGAPKGIFPFYIPPPEETPAEISEDGASEPLPLLATFPVSNKSIQIPTALAFQGGSSHEASGGGGGFQVEPEIGLVCRLSYRGEGEARRVSGIVPELFGAFNDCSHRRPGAKKISDKKNWGPASKGFAVDQLIAVDRFEVGGVMDQYRLACFLKRDGQLHAYGEDSSLSSYGYMYGQLIDWLIDKINTQQDAGPLESISDWLKVADYPSHALIAIGATRYADYGETHMLQEGDASIVVAYDARVHSSETIQARLATDDLDGLSLGGDVSILSQDVVIVE